MRLAPSLMSLALSAQALAVSGPDQIPCDGCDLSGHFSQPTSGLWYNPERSGTGMTVQMQGDLLLGVFFSYHADGSTAWYTFAGHLEPTTNSPFTLVLNAALLRYAQGACLSCPYQAPEVEESGSIQIEFTQRNHASFIVDNGERQYLIPLLLGIDSSRDFEQAEYALPELTGDWSFVLDNPAIALNWGTESTVLNIGSKRVLRNENGEVTRVAYSLADYVGTTDVTLPGAIECELRETASEPRRPVCELSLNFNYPGLGRQSLDFPLPIANIGADRIETVHSSHGIRVKALRIDFD